MRSGAPTILWRHIGGELWKLLAVTGAVLIAVIAFSVSIKPLADGKLLPLEALKFMGYALLPMSAYALPFAGGFAATLVYHRLASDNESQAASACGISHRSLLVPALVTGLVCAGAIALLNEQVIPRFWRSMQMLVTQDIAKVIKNTIDRGEAHRLEDGTWVSAERADLIDPPAGSSALAVMVLTRPYLVKTDSTNAVLSEGAAERADVWLYRDDRADTATEVRAGMRVVIQLHNLSGQQKGMRTGSEQTPPIVFYVPDTFDDDPKFLTAGELSDLDRRPERMNWIEQRRRRLAVELGRAQAVAELQAQLAGGVAELLDPQGQTVKIKAGGVRVVDDGKGLTRYELTPGSNGRVEVVRGTTTGAARLLAKTASLRAGVSDKISEREEAPILFDLEMGDASAFSGAEEPGGSRGQVAIKGLSPAKKLLEPLLGLTCTDLLRASEGAQGPAARAADDLRSKLASLRREVTSKQNERMAQAAACALMVVTGAVTALNVSSQLPLTVYLWSFVPALLSLVTISGGQRVTHGVGLPGLFLLWGGVGLLALYTAFTYARVARH